MEKVDSETNPKKYWSSIARMRGMSKTREIKMNDNVGKLIEDSEEIGTKKREKPHRREWVEFTFLIRFKGRRTINPPISR